MIWNTSTSSRDNEKLRGVTSIFLLEYVDIRFSFFLWRYLYFSNFTWCKPIWIIYIVQRVTAIKPTSGKRTLTSLRVKHIEKIHIHGTHPDTKMTKNIFINHSVTDSNRVWRNWKKKNARLTLLRVNKIIDKTLSNWK